VGAGGACCTTGNDFLIFCLFMDGIMYISQPDTHENTAKQQTILVVDDDSVVQFLLKSTLSSAKYHVVIAESGTEGLEAAQNAKPDMILLDVVLADGSGLDFCADFKKLPGLGSVPIMLMSGMATSPSEQARGLEAGADDYMAKPLAVNELLARIRTLFRLRQAEQSLLESERLLEMTQRLAKVGGWEWNVETQTLTWTEETYRIHGFSMAEPLTSGQRLEKCLQCYSPKDRKTMRDAFTRSMEQGIPFDLELPFSSADGRDLWVRVTAEVEMNHGRVIRVMGFIMDITVLKKNQEQVKSISEEYERVFQSTQDAMFLVQVEAGPVFRFIRNNLSHQQRTGLQLHDIRNKTPQELLGKELGMVLEANYLRCIQAKEPISYEERLVLPGGERIWNTTLTPVLEGVRINYIVGSSQDHHPAQAGRGTTAYPGHHG
jgi:DNA-binding response OmpR family regulator